VKNQSTKRTMFLARSNLCSKSAAARFSPSTTQLMKRSLSVSTAVDPQPLNGSKNLKWEMVGDTGIAYFTLDQEGEKVNMFSSALQSDMEDMLKTIESTPSIKAAVLASGKPGCFVAGADIKELNRCNTAAEAQALSKEGQRFLNELENCSKPIVAASTELLSVGVSKLHWPVIIVLQPPILKQNWVWLRSRLVSYQVPVEHKDSRSTLVLWKA